MLLVLLGMTQDGHPSLVHCLTRQGKRICIKAEASQQRASKVQHTLLRREQVGEINVYEGITLSQVLKGIALRSGLGLQECPTRLLMVNKTSQDSN